MAGEAGLYRPKFNHGTELRPLYSLAEWDNGLAFKNINFTDKGLPVVKIAEIKSGIGPDTKFTDGKYNDRALLADGDLLFCWSGQPETSIGTFRWWQGPAWLNQHVFKVTPTNEVSADYLRHLLRYLQSQFVQIAKNKQTTGLGHVTKADLKNMLVEVPAPGAQARITEALNPIDDKIELNRRMTATLEEMAQALFKSWFVDFDPVHAKIEGRNPGLSDATAALFPSRLGGDGLPEGWALGSVSGILDVNPPTPLRAGTLAPYIDMAALPSAGPRISGYISREASSGSRFQRGDTLVARITPCLENGKTALVDLLPHGQTGWGSTEFIVLRPRAPMSQAWPYLLARHEPFRAHLIGAMTGSSGRQRVPPSAIAAWEMALPPPAVLSAFAEIIDPIFTRISAAAEESTSLSTLRDTLLPKLVSGELRIAEAEKKVSAA